MSKRLWVLRDVSNGDGADGRPCPTYVWAFPTRAQARRASRMHKAQRDGLPLFAQLGPIERWPKGRISRLYRGGAPGGLSQFYYRRKR